MKFMRLYAGSDGQSHFEELDGAKKSAFFNDTKPATSHLFRDDFAPHIVNFHRAPRRRWVVTLTGSVTIGVGDGSSVTFHPAMCFSPKTPAVRGTPRRRPTGSGSTSIWTEDGRNGVMGPPPNTPLLHHSNTPSTFMAEIRFVDTTLRDGQLSLWASNMTTGMMLPIVENIDRAGFEAVELLSSAFFKKCVRDLKDDLWQRARLVSKRVKHTPLRSIRSRSMLAFQMTPPAIAELWLERLAANGINELRTSDPSNTPKYWADAVRNADQIGLRTILNIIYSISPKHTDEYFTQRFRAAAKLKPYRLCFKDPGGLLNP